MVPPGVFETSIAVRLWRGLPSRGRHSSADGGPRPSHDRPANRHCRSPLEIKGSVNVESVSEILTRVSGEADRSLGPVLVYATALVELARGSLGRGPAAARAML